MQRERANALLQVGDPEKRFFFLEKSVFFAQSDQFSTVAVWFFGAAVEKCRCDQYRTSIRKSPHAGAIAGALARSRDSISAGTLSDGSLLRPTSAISATIVRTM